MRVALILFFVLTGFCTMAQEVSEFRSADKLRIREAMAISEAFSERIWKGMGSTPFTMMLVTEHMEFLINHPDPSSDFLPLGKDSILNTTVHYRKRQFDPHFLATFPAVNGVNCIVVGTPENTGKSSTAWVITLLHEHFHQFEYNYPDYYDAVAKLDLSGGDRSGMWQLNYPFPYDSAIVNERYERYREALSKAVVSIHSADFKERLGSYQQQRAELKKALSTPDYTYFSFQIWQEGIARYTEYKFLELLASSSFKAAKGMAELPDFVPYTTYKDKFYRDKLALLSSQTFRHDRRTCFYEIGFAEGLLLDKLNPGWRSRFLTEKFFVEKYWVGR